MDGTLKPVPKIASKFGRTLRTIRLRSLELQRDIFAIYKIIICDTCSHNQNYILFKQIFLHLKQLRLSYLLCISHCADNFIVDNCL